VAERSDGYSIDSSSLIAIRETFGSAADRNRAWAFLESLAKRGRLRVAEQVFDEMEKGEEDDLERLQALDERCIVRITPELGIRAGRIASRFQGMSKPRKNPDKADPWVIAAAMEMNLTVVTEERPGSKSIPTACKNLGVDCIDLRGLVERERPALLGSGS
jgi:pentatricopeptide repeat protein